MLHASTGLEYWNSTSEGAKDVPDTLSKTLQSTVRFVKQDAKWFLKQQGRNCKT